MNLLKRSVLFIAVFFWAVVPVAHAEPKQFDSAEVMFEDMSDYSIDGGSLAILSESPLSIQLTKPAYKNDRDDVIKYELQRAVIYGVYRTFIHTDTPEITVKAVPVLTSYKPFKEVVLDEPVYEISITREQALKAIQEFLPEVSFSSLTEEKEYFSSWSDDFNDLYYEDRDPGLDAFYDAVEKASNK